MKTKLFNLTLGLVCILFIISCSSTRLYSVKTTTLKGIGSSEDMLIAISEEEYPGDKILISRLTSLDGKIIYALRFQRIVETNIIALWMNHNTKEGRETTISDYLLSGKVTVTVDDNKIILESFAPPQTASLSAGRILETFSVPLDDDIMNKLFKGDGRIDFLLHTNADNVPTFSVIRIYVEDVAETNRRVWEFYNK